MPVVEAGPGSVPDVLLIVAGVVISLLAVVFSALLELFLTPLRIHGVLAPVAVPFAVLANLGIAWFAVTVTGRRWALAPPWGLWTALMLVAAGARTSEGDSLIRGDDWVALVTILAGCLTFAVYGYRWLLPSRSPVKVTGTSVTKP